MIDERHGEPARLAADVLVAVLVDDVVAASLTRHAARLAGVGLRARQVLQLQGDVFGHVAEPSSFFETTDETPPPAERAGVVLERWDELDERLVEARDGVAREVLEHAKVDEHDDGRAARPDVGAAQDARLED